MLKLEIQLNEGSDTGEYKCTNVQANTIGE